MIVVDASAILELLLGTAVGERIAGRVLDARERLHSPHLLDAEVAQTLRRLALLKQVSSARAALAFDDFQALAIERHAHFELLPRVWELRSGLTAYDALYVALAEALAAPLLTCDGKLARARGHRAVIELGGRA